MLGLATRARKVVSGEFSTERALQDFSATLVIVAEDASANTKKKFKNKCEFYEVPYYEYGLMAELGHAMGKESRASLAITDEGFADSICKMMEGGSK